MKMDLGYTKPLFILAFDHRSTFIKSMLKVKDRNPDADEIEAIKQMKQQIIYEAFKKALARDVPRDEGAILVDEEYGDQILQDARVNNFITILTTEKSGQDEFDFEYGNSFGEHIGKFHPTFVKALVRYNPEGHQTTNARQRKKLKVLSGYCHDNGYKFLIEPLVLPTDSQLVKVNNDKTKYDNELRPSLMLAMIKEFYSETIEPDIWKVEGLENTDDYKRLVEQARAGNRNNVGVVILGRGEEKEQVEKWIKAGAHVEGVIGFAIGRTIFWDALVAFNENRISREQAVDEIAKNYIHFYNIFKEVKSSAVSSQ